MSEAQLYFLSYQYYLDFPDDKLMKNKDIIDGVPHNRPYFLLSEIRKFLRFIGSFQFLQELKNTNL